MRCFNKRHPIEYIHLMRQFITVIATPLQCYPSFFRKDKKIKEKYWILPFCFPERYIATFSDLFNS